LTPTQPPPYQGGGENTMTKIFNVIKLKDRRISLRNNQTPHEVLLWARLRREQLGFKFRRQHSIGGYIVDFYCPEKN